MNRAKVEELLVTLKAARDLLRAIDTVESQIAVMDSPNALSAVTKADDRAPSAAVFADFMVEYFEDLREPLLKAMRERLKDLKAQLEAL